MPLSTLSFLPKSVFLFFLLLSHSILAQKQVVVEGRVTEALSGNPLAFVNIGIKGKNVGTVSDRSGFYRLQIPENFENDSLFFSSVGYKEKGYLISEVKPKTRLNVALEEEVIALNDFLVKGNVKRKYVTYGVKKKSNIRMHTPKFYDGAQIARLIKVKDYPVILSDVRIGIPSNNTDSLLIRVRILEKDILTGAPGSDMLKDNVIENIGGKTGFIKVDLEDYELVIDSDFFISVEFLDVSSNSNRTDFFIYVHEAKKSEQDGIQYLRFGSYGDWVSRSDQGGMNSLIYALGATAYYYRE